MADNSTNGTTPPNIPESDVPIGKDAATCNIFRDFKNRSDTFFAFKNIDGYSGIPQNLVINLFGFVLMILLFSWLRKKAWNYGRIAVVQRIDDSARRQLEHVQWKSIEERDSKRVYKYPSEGQHAIPLTYVDVKNQRSRRDIILTNDSDIHPSARPSKTSDKADKSTYTDQITSPPAKDEDALPSEGPEKASNGHPPLPTPVHVVFKKTLAISEPDGKEEFVERDSIIPSITPSITDHHSHTTHKSVQRENSHRYSKITLGNESVVMDSGYFSWIKILFSLTDMQIEAKAGTDCVIYLSFQRHLIVLALVMTVCCLLIILPINIYNGAGPVNTHKIPFYQATMINISPERKHYVFAHEVLSTSFFILSIVIMRSFSKVVKFTKKEKRRRSIIITGISKRYCNETNLRNHFSEVFPNVEIKEITLAFDICNLQMIELHRQRAELAKKHYETIYEQNGSPSRPTVKPYVLGAICPRACCCCCKSVDAIQFYSQLEVRLEHKLEVEKEIALTKSLGIAFITFRQSTMAKATVEAYGFWSSIRRQRPLSKFSKQLKSTRWNVEYAPPPNDLYWENLTSHESLWFAKLLLVNLVLLIIVMFVTTPVFLIEFIVKGTSNCTRSISYCIKEQDSGDTSSFKGILLDTLPTFLLWIAGAVLPSLVGVSDEIVRFWTKSADNRSRMIKIFLFLIFMVIIMPSMGVTSLKTFISKKNAPTKQKSGRTDDGPRWTCVFSEDNGSLFANYLITSTFLGTASELLRLPELLVYFCKILFAKSTAEIESVRESVVYDFPIGSQYAWFMLNFAIFSIFCVIIPVITPFGLLYFVFRYLVDKYNIYFAYGPTKVKQEVHGTAINFVMACLFILQLTMLAYVMGWKDLLEPTQENQEKEDPRIIALKLFTTLAFAFTLTLFACQVVFNVCTSFGPKIKLTIPGQGDDKEEVGTDAIERKSGTSVAASDCSKLHTGDKNAGEVDQNGYQVSLVTMMPGGITPSKQK